MLLEFLDLKRVLESLTQAANRDVIALSYILMRKYLVSLWIAEFSLQTK